MANQANASVSSRKVIGVTRTALGFVDEAVQCREIMARCSSRDRQQLRFFDLSLAVTTGLDEFMAILRAENARKIIMLSLNVLSPMIFDLEDLLNLLAALERLSVEMVVIEPPLIYSEFDRITFGELGAAWALMKLNRKRENANASRAKAELRGVIPGQKRKCDPQEIMELREKGYTIQEIADLKQISTTSIQRALKVADQNT
jgi:DNA invertase Pin-like site-specific DNA recombinase